MAIDNTGFGGAGGGNSIPVTTDVGAKVTISKGSIVKEMIATNGVAIFNGLEAGVWNVVTSDGKVDETRQVTINDDFPVYAPLGKLIGEMPLGTKIKMGTYYWKIVAKNHEGYPENSVSLFTTESMGITKWGNTTDYKNSFLYNHFIQHNLPNFTEFEKQFLLKTNFQQKQYNGTIQNFEEYFKPLSTTEIGIDNNGEGVKIDFFKTNTDRVLLSFQDRKTSVSYSLITTSSGGYNTVVSGQGTMNTSNITSDQHIGALVNVKADMILNSEPDEEGYYTLRPSDFKIGELVEGAKIKIEDTEFIYLETNHDGYPLNSSTLIQYRLYENIPWNGSTWQDSYVRTYCNDTWLKRFSEKVQNLFMETDVEVMGIGTTKDKVFLPSSSELGGGDAVGNGKRFAYFKDNASRVAYHITNTTTALLYWTRTTAGGGKVHDVADSGVISQMTDTSSGVTIRPMINIPSDTIFTYDITDDCWKLKE